jgi:Transcriptional regulator, AbiEi antitoxin, Type IV TA system/Transcriptional regulator, AbiEi antitoxin N-terminal domain
MAATEANKLKLLTQHLVPGAPLTSGDLGTLGISADLTTHYVRAGWLTRLSRGVYAKPGDQLALRPSLLVLQRAYTDLYVGGKTALDWYGYRHYVAQRPVLHVYSWSTIPRLPSWFTERFPVAYHRKRLFHETSKHLLFVGPFEDRANEPNVAEPERAVLEVLSEVGVRQSLGEARELLESLYTLRADVLDKLLQQCTSVKTVRLCLQLGKELSQPWAEKLDAGALPKGSSKPWVSHGPNGVLILR